MVQAGQNLNNYRIYAYAVVQADIYVYTCSSYNIMTLYVIHTQLNKGEKVTVESISLPQSLTMLIILCGVNDTLFSFGGRDHDDQPSSDVNRYNPDTKKWEPAGYMRNCRYSVIISPFVRESKNKVELFVVGGSTSASHSSACRIAETCEVGLSDD